MHLRNSHPFLPGKKRLNRGHSIPSPSILGNPQSLENPLRTPAIATIHRRVAGEHAAPGPEEADYAVEGLQHQRLLGPAGVQAAEPWGAEAGWGLGNRTQKKVVKQVGTFWIENY